MIADAGFIYFIDDRDMTVPKTRDTWQAAIAAAHARAGAEAQAGVREVSIDLRVPDDKAARAAPPDRTS